MSINTGKIKSPALLSAIVFWGAVWGIAEATIGYALHMFHIPAVGAWMFPIALVCMCAAMRHSDSPSTAFAVSAVAATFKLTDLLFIAPLPFWYVTNPAGHILVEGAMTAAFFVAVRRFNIENIFGIVTSAVAAMFGVLVLQKLWQFGISAIIEHNPGVELFWNDSSRILSSLIVCGIKGLILAGVYYAYNAYIIHKPASPVPAWSASLALAVALCISWIMI